VNMLSHTRPHKPWILELDSSTSAAARRRSKPAARDNDKTVEDIKFNNDVTVDPTDNLEDINSGIFNSEVSVNEDPLKDNNNNKNNDGPITFAWGHENLTKTDAEYVAYAMSQEAPSILLLLLQLQSAVSEVRSRQQMGMPFV
jgi:hypothetical protein